MWARFNRCWGWARPPYHVQLIAVLVGWWLLGLFELSVQEASVVLAGSDTLTPGFDRCHMPPQRHQEGDMLNALDEGSTEGTCSLPLVV